MCLLDSGWPGSTHTHRAQGDKTISLSLPSVVTILGLHHLTCFSYPNLKVSPVRLMPTPEPLFKESCPSSAQKTSLATVSLL